MSDRLSELRRQRALIEAHLAWLDREIAAASTAGASVPPTAGSAKVAAPVPNRAPLSEREMEALLQPYRASPQSVRQDVRKGCLLYFFLGLLLLALGVTALAFLLRAP